MGTVVKINRLKSKPYKKETKVINGVITVFFNKKFMRYSWKNIREIQNRDEELLGGSYLRSYNSTRCTIKIPIIDEDYSEVYALLKRLQQHAEFFHIDRFTLKKEIKTTTIIREEL